MTPLDPTYATARDNMVDGQVRPNKVADPRIVLAMRSIPRERFLPAALAPRAYCDEDVRLPNGRALMEPMVVARLAQILQVRAGETALVVAAGTGYAAALLATIGATVTAVEDDPALLAIARIALPPSVALIEAPPQHGCPDRGPYDIILIDGAVPEIPDAITQQLKPAGRIAAVIAKPGRCATGVLGEAVTVGGMTHMRTQSLFDCATPPPPALRRPSRFHLLTRTWHTPPRTGRGMACD